MLSHGHLREIHCQTEKVQDQWITSDLNQRVFYTRGIHKGHKFISVFHILLRATLEVLTHLLTYLQVARVISLLFVRRGVLKWAFSLGLDKIPLQCHTTGPGCTIR